MMLGALEFLVIPVMGLLMWHETRLFGRRRDDRDVIEAAPVVAGVVVVVGYVLGGELATPATTAMSFADVGETGVWDVRRWTATRAVSWGAAVTVGLVVLEAVLDDEGYIDQEWRLFGRGGES